MIKIRDDYTFLIFLLIPILKVLILRCMKKLLQRKNKNTNTNTNIKKNREESYNNNLLQSQRNLEFNKNNRNKSIISNQDDMFEDYSPFESFKNSKNVKDYKSNSKIKA